MYSSYVGYYTYAGQAKPLYHITDATICIQAKSGRTMAEYTNTSTHELGHALGFLGHAGSSNAVMYAFGHSGYTLTTAEKNHLIQVYN